jgi:pseudouridine kinase
MIKKKPVVAVYGGSNVDIAARSAMPWRPGDSNPGTFSRSAGGVGRNIAENLARLGLQVELVTVLGDDEAADFLRGGCAAAGVETGRSLVLPGKESSAYLCVLDNDGLLVGAVAAMESMELFGPAELARRFGPGDEADVVVIDANLPPASIALAAERWKGKPLILDPVSVAKAGRAAPAAGKFSIVKPNYQEALVLLGQGADATSLAAGSDPSADPVDAARSLAVKLLLLGPKEVFVSLGAGGLLWADSRGIGLARPLALPVVNVSGAGDAATAALAWATVQRLDAETKASFAVAAASLCASAASTVAPGLNIDTLSDMARGVRNERIS